MSTNGDGNSKGGTNGGAAPPDGPKVSVSDTLAKPLPKRFYKDVTVGEGAFYQVLLDGRVIKTPGKRALILPARALAGLIAQEWASQGEFIDPSLMPLTRFANTAIDAVSNALDEVAADIVAYAGRDLLCYRAEREQLAAEQHRLWDPVLDWARESYGAAFQTVTGVMPIDQPVPALKAFARALEPHEPFRLTALHVMTTLTGSALLALACDRAFLSQDVAWRAAHVDEDYQISMWGEDYEAAEKRKQRHADFAAACRMLGALSPPKA